MPHLIHCFIVSQRHVKNLGLHYFFVSLFEDFCWLPWKQYTILNFLRHFKAINMYTFCLESPFKILWIRPLKEHRLSNSFKGYKLTRKESWEIYELNICVKTATSQIWLICLSAEIREVSLRINWKNEFVVIKFKR